LSKLLLVMKCRNRLAGNSLFILPCLWYLLSDTVVHSHPVADEPVQLFCGRYFENQDHRNWTWSPFLCM